MAFYFALLNVSKKDNNKQKEKGERRHRRHSIASVESPLLDYRLLPRPQLLSDDVVITNDLAHQMEMSSSSSHHNEPLNRASRGSARASKWVHDNHLSSTGRQQPQPSSSQQWNDNPNPNPPPLSRSKPMVFDRKNGKEKMEVKEKRGKLKKTRKSEEDEEVPRGRVRGRERSEKATDVKKNEKSKQGKQEQVGKKKDVSTSSTEPSTSKKKAVPLRPVPIPSSASMPKSLGKPSKNFQTIPKVLKPMDQPTRRRLISEHPHLQKTGTATDESGRSSSQVSNESRTPRRDDSPASTCDEEDTDKNSAIMISNKLQKEETGSQIDVAMKLSGVSMSSRSSEPRLKKVTFESSPYVISNSFLGEGAGKVLVVRRNSGSAVRRVSNDWKCAWWDRKDEEKQSLITDNLANREIEKSQTRSILRRGLIRRRSTSDKNRLLAYRNSGFLSNSQERTPESTSLSASRMTVSVDCQRYS